MSRENAILADMQKQIWAMEPRHLTALFTRLLEIEIKAPANVEVEKPNKISIFGDTAVIKISGVLLKHIPSLYRWLGIEMTSYLDVQAQLAEAVSNPAVKKIVLDIDSPGGVVSGVMETGQAIAAASAQKKVTARIEDLGASGAYWLASQAGRIEAGPNGEVGSIGVFTVYVDSSARADKEGFKVHVIRSGEHKGMGVPGAEINVEQIKAVQDVIDGMAENFIAAVAVGRKMKAADVRKLADGRTYLSADAKKNGLIDGIIKANGKMNFKETVMSEEEKETKTAEETQTATVTETNTVEKQTSEPKAATIAELKATFPDEPQFVLEQLEKKATLDAAKSAFCDVLAERLKEANAKVETLQKDKGKKAGGAEPLPAGGEGGTQAASQFLDMAKQYAAENKCSMTEALKKVRKQNPQAFDDYLASCQQNRVRVKKED